jgi:sensor histidine kinase regulating citrate/malate metabolism
MDMVNIILLIVLAAVAVLLVFTVLHLAQSRRHEERLLDRSAHTLARLIASKTRLSHKLGSSFL